MVESKPAPQLSPQQLTHEVKRARRPLLLLDYDGTLRTHTQLPQQAVPSAALLALLAQLGQRYRVYVVSGRDAETLLSWLGALPIGLVAEHGLCRREPGMEWNFSQGIDDEFIDGQIIPKLEAAVASCPHSFIERKRASVAWHYRRSDQERAESTLATLKRALVAKLPNEVGLIDGSCVLEVRRRDVNKGAAATRLISDYEPDFVFAAGDDTTDEDLFASVNQSGPRSITCRLGDHTKTATHLVADVPALLACLEKLLQ